MVSRLLLVGLLLAVAAIARAVRDAQSHSDGDDRLSRWARKRGGFWWRWADATSSWQNKYAHHAARPLRPAFPGSLTWLVWLTDAWHFAEAVSSAALGGVLVLVSTAPDALRWRILACWLTSLVVFEPVYRWMRAPA